MTQLLPHPHSPSGLLYVLRMLHLLMQTLYKRRFGQWKSLQVHQPSYASWYGAELT